MREISSLLHLQDVGLKLHYKATLSQLFPKSLAKLACQPVVWEIVKNLIIETFAYFIKIYMFLISVYIFKFLEPFSWKHLPVFISAYKCPNVAPKKMK